MWFKLKRPGGVGHGKRGVLVRAFFVHFGIDIVGVGQSFVKINNE